MFNKLPMGRGKKHVFAAHVLLRRCAFRVGSSLVVERPDASPLQAFNCRLEVADWCSNRQALVAVLAAQPLAITAPRLCQGAHIFGGYGLDPNPARQTRNR